MKYQRFRLHKNHARKAEINITPMIDIMTSLMAVFMITAPLLTSGMDIDLPKGGKSVLSKGDNSLDVSITTEGKIYVGGDTLSVPEFKAKLAALKRENPKLTIIISSDKKNAYGSVIAVMGMVKDAGFANVGLKTAPVGKDK
jgi:biopolymer transport protein TolR